MLVLFYACSENLDQNYKLKRLSKAAKKEKKNCRGRILLLFDRRTSYKVKTSLLSKKSPYFFSYFMQLF